MFRQVSASPLDIMNITGFTNPQRQAFLDLLVLAMYADGRLCSAEDQRVEQLLTGMGFEPGYDHQREFDASVTRVRRHSQPTAAACAHAAELARSFTTQDQRRTVYDLLNDLIGSDHQVSADESRLLTAVKEVFQL